MRRAALLLSFAILAAAPRAADKWTYAATERFEVYAMGGDRQAREALTYFERVHAFFTEFLKLSTRPDATPTRLIAFAGDREFAPYSPNRLAAAFYVLGPDRDYIVVKSIDEDSNPIVVHEYAHSMLRRAGAQYPLWLEEGLAEFFSTMAPEGNRMGLGRPREDLLRYLTGTAMLPLDRLFAVTVDAPEYSTRTHAGVFYSQSWALTHMLLADDRYRARSGQLLSLLAKGTPSAEAFATVYARPLEDVTADLAGYVRRDRYTYFLAAYKAPPSLARLPTRAVEAFEADLATTNLLASMPDREADARAGFERLASQKPDDLLLLESRAQFEMRRGHGSAALPYFARAVAGGSRSASLYRDYAVLEPSKAEELLAMVVALDPGDLDSRLTYAGFLVARRRSADALTTLTAVTNVPEASAFRWFRLLASTYMQLNRMGEARTAAAHAETRAKTREEKEQAAQLARTIEESALRTALQQKGPDGQEIPTLSTVLKEPPVVETGRIRNVVCGNGFTVLEVRVGTATRRLLIDKPGAINVIGRKSNTVDLKCGAQDIPIRIGYEPAANTARKTTGNVRMLDYRQ
jgi:tetratricopeptide (TPR) repeat protein